MSNDITIETVELSDDQARHMNRALDLYKKEDGRASLFQLKRLYQEGCGAALHPIGYIYETGCGEIDRDNGEAVSWYKKSIEAMDDVPSHRALARIYINNFDFDPTHELLHYHLGLLAEAGHMGGHFGLGFAKLRGIGCDVDNEKAAAHFRIAADMGHLEARRHLYELAEELSIGDIFGAFLLGLRIRHMKKSGKIGEEMTI